MPSTVQAFNKGDYSLGTPRFHFIYTNLYTFDHGWLKGIEVGGTVNAQYKNVAFYYLTTGFTTANPTRAAFFNPNSATFDPILGYSRKFGRFTWRTRLNIANLFNTYKVVVIPSQSTGYTTISNLGAAFFGQPRSFTWTNTISF